MKEKKKKIIVTFLFLEFGWGFININNSENYRRWYLAVPSYNIM